MEIRTERDEPDHAILTPAGGENGTVEPSDSESLRAGSEAEGRDEDEEEEEEDPDLDLRMSEEAIYHPRVSEDGTPVIASDSSGGSKSSEGGRRVSNGEEEERRGSPPSNVVVNGTQAESQCGVSSGGGSDIDGDQSGPTTGAGASPKAGQIDEIQPAALYGGRQNPPSGLHELAEVLAEPFGSAVATVFYEVFEHSGFGGTNAIAVNDLSRLLEAALKQSLFYVLREERASFVANFRNSFRSTFKTIRSVRRISGKTKTGIRLSRSGIPYLRSSGRSSTSKQRLPSENGTRKVSSRRKLEGSSIEGTRKEPEFGATKIKRSGSRRNHSRQSLSDEKITNLNSRFMEEEERSDESLSCLDESLQSFFFTDSNGEEDGYPDTPRSCSKSCLNESLNSAIFSSTSLEHAKQLRRSKESGNAVLESPLSQATPDARDVRLAEDSGDDVFSSCSSEIDNWLVVDRDEVTSERLLRLTSNPLTLRGDGERDDSLVDSQGQGHRHSPGNVDMSLNSRTSRSRSGSSIHVPDARQSGNPSAPFARSSGATKIGPSDEPIARPDTYSESRMGRQEGVDFHEGADYFGNVHVPSRGRQADSMVIHSTSEQAWIAPFQDYEGLSGGPALLQRYVEAQENKNRLKHLGLTHKLKRFSIMEENLQLQAESNSLMKENLDLSRTKIDFKEYELEDRKLTAAHRELSQMCADELVAGLCVMLLSLAYAAWKFSNARLSEMTMCKTPPREPRPSSWLGTSWMSDKMDAFDWHFKSITCTVTKAGRMLSGIILIAFVASLILRRKVTSSSQTMPATIIIVVLGGLCGFAGKISIDNLGGDGYLWVFFWEALCLLHVFATCCTPWLYKYLYGPSSKFFQAKTSFWLKSCSVCIRIFFHTFLVLTLPIMAGLLPFASPEELYVVLGEFWKLDQF